MHEREYAYTQPSGSYPGYVNLKRDGETVGITVRSDPDAGQCGTTSRIVIPAAQVAAIARDFLRDEPQP